MSQVVSLSSLNNTYNNYYIYTVTRGSSIVDGEDNRAAADAVTTAYCKDWKYKYSCINLNIISIYDYCCANCCRERQMEQNA